jgi:glycosidase
MFEFHVSRQARDRYQFDQSLFNLQGNVIFANFHAARVFAQKMNQARDLVTFPEQAVRAGQINAMGLVDEILHQVLALYRKEKNSQAMIAALDWLTAQIGQDELEKALVQFEIDFPSLAVYRRELSIPEYLEGSSDGIPNRALVLEELLMLWVTNKNPAVEPYRELFNDERLTHQTAYLHVMQELHQYFETQPHFGPDDQNLIDMLRSPALANPYSLTAQLEFIRTRWTGVLGAQLYRLLSSLDLIKEEEKASFFGGGPGPVPIPVYDRATGSTLAAGTGGEALVEIEKFSLDRDWMPRLVLMAKNSYVWLDQLSKIYRRPIYRLDQIPDEELDLLAQRGFTGLWLIGLWERSQASARIKQLCGNPDAIASAYSLFGYTIAADLGGEEAYRNLRDRAWQRGIRLASDMVPNHMGIDSPWVVEHPDWFISLNQSPYPAYSFNGPDLSQDGRISINIEDHYFDRTDAAVVFKRYDHSNGDTRYIYHGNDGTSMPWNDTAQLNYLNPEVREAVIQTILHVARQFPIIRFDAAMTLAKRHLQRLWYPEPGSGGAIPSRAEHSLTKEQFEAAVPIEFWREVVDRAAVEAPDTLLLAEAFWMMEGYFVRTLGMHRVYNSAFMNLLRNEDNAKYRTVMKNTLEFDPEILKRFVNFMNNPDERTAVDQFGKGDKYFGICTLMATLPGLPMFGHGQIEGFTEKYGMEFRRANWDEQVDPFLVERHQREIFPLFHHRALFAGVEHFLLYDFFGPDGHVNEDVYAYSNGLGNERNLVVYHNRYADARGWVRTSVGFSVKTGSDEQRAIVQRSLGDGLSLHPGPNSFVIFRDHTSQLEFIRPANEMIREGLYLELRAYEVHVYLDFRQVEDDAWHSYRQLCSYLGGRGVPNIQEAMRELVVQPVLEPFRQIANPGYWQYLKTRLCNPEQLSVPETVLSEAGLKAANLISGMIYLDPALKADPEVAERVQHSLKALLSLALFAEEHPFPGSRLYPKAVQYVLDGLETYSESWPVWFTWAFLAPLGQLSPAPDRKQRILSWIDEWQFNKVLLDAFQSNGASESAAARQMLLVRILIQEQDWYTQFGGGPLITLLESWLSTHEVRTFLNVNRHQDILWFNQEAFEEYLWWMMLLALLESAGDPQATATELIENVLGAHEIVQKLLKAEKASGYQVDRLLGLVSG